MIYATPAVELDAADGAIDGEDPISAEERTAEIRGYRQAIGSPTLLVVRSDGRSRKS